MDTSTAADAYAEADFDDVNRKFVDAVVEHVGTHPIENVLDLGCGPADIPLALIRKLHCVRVVAIEAAAEMLHWAAKRVAADGMSKKIALVRGDAKRLPLPDQAFDAVISNSILHHVADPVEFWSEAVRVARRPAFIYMRDLMRPKNLEAAQRLVDEHAQNESEELRGEFFRSLCAAYTVGEVTEQLAQAGLQTLTVRTVSDRHLDVVGLVK